MSEEVDKHVLRKYELVQRLGKGVRFPPILDTWSDVRQAYGIVWKAVDKKTRETLALKKIFDAFINSTDAQRTFREIMFLQVRTRYFVFCSWYLQLQELNDHENIIKIQNVIKAENDKDIYLTFEYMGMYLFWIDSFIHIWVETDLHAVIRANILEEIHKQYIMYQVFKAIRYMHSGELLHRDMKVCAYFCNCYRSHCSFPAQQHFAEFRMSGQDL